MGSLRPSTPKISTALFWPCGELTSESGLLEISTAAKKIADVAYHDSRRDNLLQVVDMVVGAIARTHEKGDSQYQRLFRRKIRAVQLFPPLDAP